MPRTRRHRSWHKLTRRLDTLPDGVRVLSLDVFETLLLRQVEATAVARAVERELVRRLRLLGREPARNPAMARFDAFTLAAERNAARGGDFGASLKEALPLWIAETAGSSFVPPAGLVADLEEYEWQCECAIVAPNSTLIPWLEKARQQVDRLIFISDMYFSRERIHRLLENVGYTDIFDTGYVSGDEGVLKATGNLFTRVTEGEGVDAGALLHVGDDFERDGLKASERGCRAHVVEDRRRLRQLARFTSDRKLVLLDGRWGGPALARAACATAPRHRAREEDVAYRILGPIVCSFVLRVAERCRELGVRRIYFLSREGHVLKAVYQRIARLVWPDDDGPPTTYLCVSRLSTLVAGARFYDLRVLEAALRNHRQPTVRTLFAPFEIPEELLIARATEYGLGDLDTPLPGDPWWWSPVQRLLSDPVLAEVIADEHHTAQQLLVDYLESEAFFDGGRVAFVDIGWTGQIQEHLLHAVQHVDGLPQVMGLYLGVKRAASARYSTMSYSEGLLADERVIGWGQQAVFRFPQGLEELLRAPHGTVIGYSREADGTVRPRVREEGTRARRQESQDEERTGPLQHALVEYAGTWATACELLEVGGHDLLPYARAELDRLLRLPREDERQLLSGVSNVCDLGMEVVVPLGDTDESTEEGRGIMSLAARLRHSFWLHGTLHATFSRIAALPAVAAVEVALAPKRDVETLQLELHHGNGGAPPELPSCSPSKASPGTRLADEADLRRRSLSKNARGALVGWPGVPIRPPGLRAALASSALRVAVNLGCRLLGKHPYRADLLPLRLWLRASVGTFLQTLMSRAP